MNYNGLLVKFQRRFANGFSFMNSYTYGLAIDLSSDNDGGVALVNTYDPGYNRGPADYDVKHTFVSNWIYAVPFAKNSKLSMSRVSRSYSSRAEPSSSWYSAGVLALWRATSASPRRLLIGVRNSWAMSAAN